MASKKAAKKKPSKKKARKKTTPRRKEADFKPGRWHVNQTDAAEFCGVAVQVFQRRGIDPVGRAGRSVYYDLRALKDWEKTRERRRGFDEGQVARPAGEENIILETARAELDLTREKAEGQRLKNAEMRRELAPVQMLSWAVSQAGSQISAVLGTLKGKIKRAQPNLGSEALHEVEQVVAEVQNIAAELTLDWDEFDDSDLADPRSDQ